ncbi:hypothetical protein LguiA_017404 [Lonicera macranthoides]
MARKGIASSSSISSDSCPSFSRLSFDAIELASLHSSSPENLILKPYQLSNLIFRQKTGMSFQDFSLIRQIGSGGIEKVYLCRLWSDESCFYTMKVVDKQVLSLNL